MPKEALHKCAWANCNHPSRDLNLWEGVQIGNRYYHEDCAHKAKGMIEIRNYYYENIDKAVVMKQLVAAIKNLILVKDVDPDFVVFTLKYAVKNQIPVKSPYSMAYFVTDAKFKDAWERYKYRLAHPKPDRRDAVEKAIQARQAKQTQGTVGVAFTFDENKPKNFADIFGKE